jgi:hypothetical protein
MPYGRIRFGATALLVVVCALNGHAQATTDGRNASPAPGHSVRGAIERWMDLQAAAVMARYRRVESSSDTLLANHMQDSLVLRGRVKFDARGRYALGATFQTGNTFTGSWNNVGWGTGGPRTTGIYLKHLFVSAAPVKGVEFSYGSLGFVRGESSEITSYDNDGYMLGGRATIRRPANLFLDEISYTQGFFGDPATPGFSDRYERFGTVNFHQLLAAKKFGPLFAISGDYTNQDAAGIARAAFSLRTPRARVIDSLRYEQYCRVQRLPACGLAATVEKALHARVTVSGGYANVDPDFGGVNGDRYTRGRRVFEQVSVRLLRDLTVSAFATQAFHNAFTVANDQRLDLVVAYNALGPLQRAGLFR